MNQFVPPGYVQSSKLLEEEISSALIKFHGVESRNVEERDWVAARRGRDAIDPSRPAIAAILSSLDVAVERLQARLYSGDLVGCYVESFTNSGILEIEPAFWASELGAAAVKDGCYFPFGRQQRGSPYPEISTSLLIRDAALAASGAPETSDTKKSDLGGRPYLQGIALDAYQSIYPEGHLITHDRWKTVVKKVSEIAGRSISERTIRDALKGMQKEDERNSENFKRKTGKTYPR